MNDFRRPGQFGSRPRAWADAVIGVHPRLALAGRLMALADLYDALISERVYKSGYSHEQAREMILARSGTHFDPDVVAAFLGCEDEFQRTARDYSDQLPLV